MKIGGYPIVFLQLLICCGISVFDEKRRKNFVLRLALSLAVSVAVTFLLEYWNFGDGFKDFRFIVLFFILFGMILGVELVCFEIKPIRAVFSCSCGYSLQHIIYCVVVIVLYFAPLPANSILRSSIALRYLCIHLPLTIPVAACTYIFFVRKTKNAGLFDETDLRSVVLSCMILVCAVVLNEFSRMKMGNATNPFTTSVVCKVYSLLCCVFILFLQFATLGRKHALHEKMCMEFVYKQKKSQYEFSKETIDLINMKYHDLKHQLSALRTNPEMSGKAIDDIERQIGIYDSIVRTGNETLDVILTETSLRCKEKQITFSFTVDGAALGMMDALDIYSLFGNALDNAVNGVAEEQKENRTVFLCVYTKDNMLFINIENYCSRQIDFVDGLPKTTGDERFHGFGTRSIGFIVKKYSGHLNMSHSDNTFYIGIVIPIN